MADSDQDTARETLIAVTQLTTTVQHIQSDVADIKAGQANFASKSELARLEKEIHELTKLVRSQYVPISRFTPIEKAVYALLTLIAMTVVGAMLAQVVIAP